MEIGILGLPKSGKTTLFNALTGMQASVSAYGSAPAEPNVAVVRVSDPRVDRLKEMFESKKAVHPSIKYVDLAGVAAETAEQAHGLPEAHLRHLGLTDALLAVVRAFTDEGGRAPDPAADLAAIDLELLLSDMQRVENRLPRLERSPTNAKGGEREKLLSELSALTKIKECLEREEPIRALNLEGEEEKAIRGFQFLSRKPLLAVFNVSEDALQSGPDWTARFADRWVQEQCVGIQVCATLEMEIARLAAQEREAFLADYGIARPAADRIIRLSYELLGLVSFLTVGPEEAHAWTIRRGTLALQAAGAVHSDMQRGFIRAETVSYGDLMAAGSMAEARKRGLLRLEGKSYEVRDGDVITFRFSV